MPKKKEASKPVFTKPPNPSSLPLLIPHIVGSGISKRTRYELAVKELSAATKPPHISEEEWGNIRLDAWRAITPEQRTYDSLEKTAKRVLEDVKLPTADSIYSIPDGRPIPPEEWKTYSGPRGTLVSLAEAKGYRERIDTQWYAAKILVCYYALRRCLDKDPKPYAATGIAFDLGMLARELEIMIEYIKKNAQKGGPKKERTPGVKPFVRKRLRANPMLSATALLDQIRRASDDSSPGGPGGIQSGKFKLKIENERLVVKAFLFLKHEGCREWRVIASLAPSSFRKYVTETRKSLAR